VSTARSSWPQQLRRHVFLDAGSELQECALQVQAPFTDVKALVDAEQLRLALPAHWKVDSPSYFMVHPTAMASSILLPAGHAADVKAGHGARVVRFADALGRPAATGRVVLNGQSAVFDRIETFEPHRRKGLGSAVMCALDARAEQAGISERLLVATEAGRALYTSLGWRVLAPYSSAVST
jgi:GNAT superfamily N-acetyltransferase